MHSFEFSASAHLGAHSQHSKAALFLLNKMQLFFRQCSCSFIRRGDMKSWCPPGTVSFSGWHEKVIVCWDKARLFQIGNHTCSSVYGLWNVQVGLVEQEEESALLRDGYCDCWDLAFALRQCLTLLGFIAWWNDLGNLIISWSLSL